MYNTVSFHFSKKKKKKRTVLRERLDYKYSWTNLEAIWSHRLLGSVCFCIKFNKSNIKRAKGKLLCST